MFIISKRNFLVRRADGSSYLVRKDFVGDIPDDVFNSTVIQGAIQSGLVATPDTRRDKDLYKADEAAQKKEDAADIRPDAKAEKENVQEEEQEEKEPELADKAKKGRK